MAEAKRIERPLSPFMFVQYYRLQLTAVTSVMIRITGNALMVATLLVIWWLLAKTTFGFEVSTVGANRHAAVYAGISVKKITVITMAISAFLAGLGGAIETQGVVGRFIPGDNSGLGFDGITIALLAKSNPIAVIPAAEPGPRCYKTRGLTKPLEVPRQARDDK